jgi:hypothetical protein
MRGALHLPPVRRFRRARRAPPRGPRVPQAAAPLRALSGHTHTPSQGDHGGAIDNCNAMSGKLANPGKDPYPPAAIMAGTVTV